MNRPLMIGAALVGLAGLLVFSLSQKPATNRTAPATDSAGTEPQRPLSVFCAASNRTVMESIRKAYQQETGREIEVQYGASQTLLTNLEISRTGDLYLPADSSYLEMANSKSLIAERFPLAKMKLVVAVLQGNPKQINGLSDLLRSDVRLVQANPDAAAAGKLTRSVLSAKGQWQALEGATEAFRGTVTDVASDLKVGAADAGIVYDAVLHDFPELEAIEIPELAEAVSDISVAVVKSTSEPQRALHFARWLSASDKGLRMYAEHGFQTVPGDQWSEHPEIVLYAGAMLRPAIEQTIQRFEEREGVEVTRVYNGCGILVAQMKAGENPDAYFACDQEFMNQVPDLFPAPVDVSENELVILVQKGNPHQVAELKDLTNEGLRVGIGHEKQCAMGWLTQNTLKEGGVQESVMKNVTVQSPTGDLLVNQMLAGSLDAAVVYLSNAVGADEKLDAVRIQGLPCSIATQPFAISEKTRFPRLTSRLLDTLRSEESKNVFLQEGFRWKESK
ncbi:MAG: substrate-binding domain-containing protein [Planctomycetaceae bacterium]